MSGCYRGWWWAYFGGVAAGWLAGMGSPWFLLPVAFVGVMSFTQRIDA